MTRTFHTCVILLSFFLPATLFGGEVKLSIEPTAGTTRSQLILRGVQAIDSTLDTSRIRIQAQTSEGIWDSIRIQKRYSDGSLGFSLPGGVNKGVLSWIFGQEVSFEVLIGNQLYRIPQKYTMRNMDSQASAIAAIIIVVVVIVVLMWIGKSTGNKKNWFGLLVEPESNMYSLSRFQLFLWNIVFIVSYIYLAIAANKFVEIKDGGGFTLPDVSGGVLGLLSVSGGSIILAYGISRTKGGKAQKLAESPRFTDLFFEGGSPSMVRFQMFMWTIVGAVVYITMFCRNYQQLVVESGQIQLPSIPEGLLVLTGISQATYLGGKLVSAVAPTINRILPRVGFLAGGTTIAVDGTGFSATETQMMIDGKTVSGLKVGSASSLEAQSPRGTKPGWVDVVIDNSGKNTPTARAFCYIDVSPLTSAVAGGGDITVKGLMANELQSFTIGGKAVALNSQAESILVGKIPPGAVVGSVDLELQLTAGDSAKFERVFTYTI